MVGLQRRPSADIIPFPVACPAARPDTVAGGSADSQSADAVRGTILLFTGVRYERLPDPAEPGLPAPERRCRR
ncbi:hypothetical protein [Methylobacterium frigidaeris]|uniref:Uncharacterized protein n=1 Tax=Methylobacterium frigidaeris TaxID=2038277 RepID=A0AA37HG63_9HYPH|nr:hypothetical protein [Methylobacterium frigidaeris]PIK72776.1 hypothetical protein CS379_12125 [Methylobacterium frigidaeris]GJD64954.1 hypothetical protein MPEAHAMD_5140 [Methylobacterium frigidaeris]